VATASGPPGRPLAVTGVASAVGTLSWLVFAPGAVFLGWIARAHGVDAADWTLAVIAALVGTLLVRASIRRSEPIVESVPAVADEAGDLDCRTLEDLVTDHLDGRLDPGQRTPIERHLAECDGCATYLAQVRKTIAVLEALGTTANPPLAPLRPDTSRSALASSSSLSPDPPISLVRSWGESASYNENALT